MPTGMQLCQAAQERLQAAGVADPQRDAARLFQHALELALGRPVPRHHLAGHLADMAGPDLARIYAGLIDARAARQPVAQIIGRRAFWKHDFRVTRDTLDPRPETETLIEAALAEPFASVLDLGTGTGAILISLLAERPAARGLGTDISPAALSVARENSASIGVCADFIESDWFSAVAGAFDLVVSNPPYIALNEIDNLSTEVVAWEPRQALTDEGDGLSAYRAITRDAPAHLTPGGRLIVEIGPSQGAQVAALMGAAGLGDLRVLPDLDGRDRIVCGRKPR